MTDNVEGLLTNAKTALDDVQRDLETIMNPKEGDTSSGTTVALTDDTKAELNVARSELQDAKAKLNNILSMLNTGDGARPEFASHLADAIQNLDGVRTLVVGIPDGAGTPLETKTIQRNLIHARTKIRDAHKLLNLVPDDLLPSHATDLYVRGVLRDQVSAEGISFDPGLQDDLVMFRGYLGKSRLGDNYRRLFINIMLNEFFDFRAEDVVRIMLTSDDLTNISYLWVKKSAVAYHTRIRSVNQQGAFLQGAISSGTNQQNGNVAAPPVSMPNDGSSGSFRDPVPSIVGFGCGTSPLSQNPLHC